MISLTTLFGGVLMSGLFGAAQPEAVVPRPVPAQPAPQAVQPGCGQACGPRIVYRHALCGGRVCCDGPSTNVILQVKEPESCCVYEVPICLPSCCTGEPKVSSRCALLSNGVVWYDWCCGFSVKIVFACNGTIVVTYVGA